MRIAIIYENQKIRKDEKFIKDIKRYFLGKKPIRYQTYGRKVRTRSIHSFQTSMNIHVKFVDFDENNLPDAILCIRHTDEFDRQWRERSRDLNVGFKSMRYQKNIPVFIKLENVGLGLYVSTFNTAWSFATEVNSSIGIHVTQNKVGIVQCSDKGNITKSIVLKRDKEHWIELLEIVNTNLRNNGDILLVSGMITDEMREHLLETNERFVNLILDPEGLRIFDLKQDRKIARPLFVELSDNYFAIMTASAENIRQGTPHPIVAKYFGNYSKTEKIKINKTIIKLSHLNPWYTGNYAKLPLPLHAAERAISKEPISMEKLDVLPTTFFSNLWFI